MDLSIIIPAYNAEKTVCRAIDSAISQKTDYEFEIIVINDGSNDATEKQLEKYNNSPKIKIYSHENRGIGKTRSEGLELASGKYISYLDADDYLLEGAVQAYLSTAFEKKSDIVIFDSQFIFEGGKIKPYPALEKHKGGRITSAEYYLSMPGPWNKVMKKSLFTELGITFPEKIWYEDLATIPTLVISAGRERLYYLKKTLHSYVCEGESITRHSSYKEKFADIIPAVEHSVIYTRDLLPNETCFLAWHHFYRSFAWTFFKYGRYDKIHRMNKVFLHYFPKWKRNKYILKQNPIAVFYSYLFINEKFSILKFLKRR